VAHKKVARSGPASARDRGRPAKFPEPGEDGATRNVAVRVNVFYGLGLVGRWVWKIIAKSPPDATHHARDANRLFGRNTCGGGHPLRSFGFELQGPCPTFASWRVRKCDPKTFSFPAHNQELVLRHMTFALQQPFQISLECGLCLNHRIERLLHRGRQIICIDVLSLQFFLCHCCSPS
jgi:hypothetical protein